MSVRGTLPPLGSVRAAMRQVTQRLTLEVDRPMLQPPAWTDLEWRLAPAVAAIHGISALLATALLWRGPGRWMAFLAEQRNFTRKRHDAAFETLARIGELARQHRAAITCLKGAALYSLGIYAPGERPMADLDFLVRQSDLGRVDRILTSLGYRELATSWKHRSYSVRAPDTPIRLGEDPTIPPQIDVHTQIAERLPHRLTDISDLVFTEAATPGLNGYPSRAALMIHLLVHAAGNMVQRELRLVQLVDLTRVSMHMNSDDWDRILEYNDRNQCLWWASAPLTMASRCFPHWALPTEVKTLSGSCPRRLRRAMRRRSVTEFSHSRLTYDRFPGLAWVRSYREALAYIVHRLLHARAQLAQAQLLSGTGTWKAITSGGNGSQLSRLLRGMISRPLRMVTARVVRAALEESDS